MHRQALLLKQANQARLDQPLDKITEPIAQSTDAFGQVLDDAVGFGCALFHQAFGCLELAIGLLELAISLLEPGVGLLEHTPDIIEGGGWARGRLEIAHGVHLRAGKLSTAV